MRTEPKAVPPGYLVRSTAATTTQGIQSFRVRASFRTAQHCCARRFDTGWLGLFPMKKARVNILLLVKTTKRDGLESTIVFFSLDMSFPPPRLLPPPARKFKERSYRWIGTLRQMMMAPLTVSAYWGPHAASGYHDTNTAAPFSRMSHEVQHVSLWTLFMQYQAEM